MIESDTNYSFLVESMPQPTCASVRALSDRFISNLPEASRDKLFAELKQDGNQLTTEPRLCAYTYAFGAVREARLRRAFTHLPDDFMEHDVELIDYGCGVGLGVMAYHDLLRERQLPFTSVRRITLIDPAARCLQRAALHARAFFPGAELRTVCKYMDELQPDDIATAPELHTLHIFSHVSDLNFASVEHLANTIRPGLRGHNCFVCATPFCERPLHGTPPSDLFVELMDVPEKTVMTENFSAGRFVPGERWTAALRIFSKDGTDIRPVPPPPPPPAIPEDHRLDEIIASLNEPEDPEHIRLLRQAAEEGQAKAQNKLGYLYDTGRELTQNDAEAVRWYRRAAAQNHPMAQYNLANHYLSGRGVPQDTDEAIKWYRRAADRGVLPAMNNIGVIYASGRGVRRNEAEAVKWYRRAAERGDETAIRNLKKRGIKV